MRQHRFVQIVLRQERREHRALRLVLRRVEKRSLASGDAAALHMQHRIAAPARAAVQPPHVRIRADAGDDLLALAEHLDRAHAVAQERRTLKPEALRFALHLLAQRACKLAIASGEQLADLFHALLIFFLLRLAAAPPVAPVHVVIEARALLSDVTREYTRTGGQPERLAHRVDRCARLAPSAERTEVACAVVRRSADHREARIRSRGKAHKGIPLVILEQDVVVRLMLLDE